MAYLEGSALDRAELLEALLTFLDANGWDRSGDEITNSLGTTFAFDAALAIPNRATYPSGSVPDGSFGVKIKTDSFGVAGFSALRYSNDFTGPFAATYFFTDGVTCAVVVKSANLRYSHIVFGHVDKHDLYTAEVPFVAGISYQWWWRIANYWSDSDSGFNYIYSDQHGFGYFGENNQCISLVPDGVVDPTLGFTDGLHYPDWHNTSHQYPWVSNAYDSGNVGESFILDYFTGVQNQSMTGGVPLHALPVIVDAGTVLCYLGELSLVRLVNIVGLSPGQVISFAGDDWVAFPMKQQGDVNAQVGGATPLPICNSGYYGLAFKK
jgi:hypothetical protein